MRQSDECSSNYSSARQSLALSNDRLSRRGPGRHHEGKLAPILRLALGRGLGELARLIELAGRARKNGAQPLSIGGIKRLWPDKRRRNSEQFLRRQLGPRQPRDPVGGFQHQAICRSAGDAGVLAAVEVRERAGALLLIKIDNQIVFPPGQPLRSFAELSLQ